MAQITPICFTQIGIILLVTMLLKQDCAFNLYPDKGFISRYSETLSEFLVSVLGDNFYIYLRTLILVLVLYLCNLQFHITVSHKFPVPYCSYVVACLIIVLSA